MKRIGFLAVLVVLLVAGSASAQSTATLGVTATVTSSVSVTLTSGAATLGGTSTAATFGFGNIAAYGYTAPTGVTFVNTPGTNYTVSLPFNVVVAGANLPTNTYSIAGALNSAAATGVTYKVNTVTVTNSSTPIATGVAVGTTGYTFTIDVAYTAAAGAADKTLSLTVTGT